ncbi:MAG TPA: cell division protein FtsW [Bacteroidetes bacterium]|nr:cell division protein FtsW [Bacteroidota bacterium]
MLNWILHRLKGDKLIWLAIFLIAMFSLLAVYTGAGAPVLAARASTEYYLIKHALLLGGGFVIMFVVSFFDYRIFAKISNVLLYLAIPVLVYTLIMGQAKNDAVRWIYIFGQSFQPSDLGKVALVIYLAKMLTQKQEVIKDFQQGFLPSIFWILLICGLIAPADLSTAALLFVTSLLVMFIAGVELKYIGGLIAIGLLAFLLLANTAERGKIWKGRYNEWVASLTDPNHDPGYQVEQARGAMASGGIIGKGAGKSSQRNWLPASTSDMIYPIIIEEYGTIGGIIVLGLYVFLLFRVVGIVIMSKTFGAILAAGLAFLVVLQAMANMAVAVGIFPVTGLPLPMLSMGGTSILFTGFSLGIILSVSKNALKDQGNNKNNKGGKRASEGDVSLAAT